MRFFLFLFILISCTAFGQLTNEFWSGAEVQRKLNSKLDVSAGLNARGYDYNFRLFYPELTFKYKIVKWFKPSVDYRGLIQLNKYGNYKFSNRINVNANFEKSIKKMTFGFRVRYQYDFGRIQSSANYSPEFDQSIRLKPSFEYNIKKSKFTPTVSVEWFYNPQYTEFGHRFTKIRASVGCEINLPGPNTMSINYLYGQNINSTKEKNQNIISVSYSYLWGEKKK